MAWWYTCQAFIFGRGGSNW